MAVVVEQEEAEKYIFNESLTDIDRDYVMELTTYGLQRLEKEPEYLLSEKKRLDCELEDVTVDNLSIFLKTSTTVNESQNLVHSMQSHVDDIILTIPNLISSSVKFSDKTHELRLKRKSNRQIVSNQMKVLEILELPQLMWKCARSKLYQQALDLESYANDLYNRNPDILILSSLIQQMKKTQKYILNELLISLEKSIQLPQCLKIIGYLTRINVFNNDQLLLRKEFLSRRLKYLQSLLPKLPTNNSSNDCYDYLSKFMDLYRRHIFSIVTQYRAIFVDDTSFNNDNNDNDNNDNDTSSNNNNNNNNLLIIWIHKRVINIISTIENLLPFVNSGSFIASLAQTCDYCGQSLGQVGMDFRGLLPQIFEKKIINLYETNCNTAILQFKSALTSHDWFVTTEILSTMNIANNNNNDDNNGPPQILLQYPPLAVLTNGYIKSFNELREFVTYSVMNDCKTILINSIQATVNSIRKFSVSSHHHHYHHNLINNPLSSKLKRKKKRLSNKKQINQNKNKNKNKNQPNSVNDERRRSMANISTPLENDIVNNDDGDNKQEEEEEDILIDEIDDEMDQVLANLVKVECEYLLPFLCDIFDLIFERRKEIQIDDLLEYFVGLYEIPQFTTISDDDDDGDNNDGDINDGDNNNDDNKDKIKESESETKLGHDPSNKSLMSDISDLDTLTIVNNDVDDDTIDIN